ncbi:MAG: right-handed parallel beta-helix repeat-containing protein [Candidatus Marinimicrobia bacterium]|nr:right-handed parallel beta-helix repeat-containing protein [Candidatus Neomarinimicrobiota bacterium]
MLRTYKRHISIITFLIASFISANSNTPVINNNSLLSGCEFGVEDSFGECCENPFQVWADVDNDGHGDLESPALACLDYGGWVTNHDDMSDEIFCISNDIDQCGICDGDGKGCTGCTDEDALNYDETAVVPDMDSCVYASEHIWHVSNWGSDSTGVGTVDNPFETIPHAVIVAEEHDTILVHSGSYLGPIDFDDKNLYLTSMYCFLPDSFYISNTILDGQGQSSVVSITGGQDSTSVLCGFTLKNGVGFPLNNSDKLRGGGVICYHSDPQLKHLIITENLAYYGGGIYCSYANPTITRTHIINNIADGGNASEGGGMYCYNSSPNMYKVTVRGNNSIQEDGGGIVLNMNSSPHIENVIIDDNHCYLRGGGLFCWNNSSPTLKNVQITRNTATIHAAGVHLDNNCDPVFQNVLFAQNEVLWNDGGGIYVYHDSQPIFINCTITDNITNSGEGAGLLLLNGSNTLLVNSILWANTPEEFYVQGGSEHISFLHCSLLGHNPVMDPDNPSIITWIDGNMSANPDFTYPDTLNYELGEESQCIDAGVHSFEWNDIVYEIEDFNGAAPDLGYKESIFNTSQIGDINLDGVLDILDIVQLIQLILSGEEPFYYELILCDMNSDGFINVLDIILLINLILNS